MFNENQIKLIGLANIPIIKKGDDISKIIIEGLFVNKVSLDDGDLIVIAQSIISKSNGRIRNLNEITPSDKALKLYDKIAPKSKKHGLPVKPPELIQAIIEESKKIIKAEHILITETNYGFICANAGIDRSNVEGIDNITLLPKNPDMDAEKIRSSLKNSINKNIGVIITDSFGRPFRVGSVGVAIGVSGIEAILDKRGEKDLFGHELQTTIIGQVDNIASAAQLIMGEADEGIPVVVIKGYKFELTKSATIRTIIREKEYDLFRENYYDGFVKILKGRRSYKLSFENKEVDLKVIKECLELAQWAPSAHNGQFWRYIIIKNDSSRKKLINKMNEKLEVDLRKEGRSEDYINGKINKTRTNFLQAPILILLCLDETNLDKYPDYSNLIRNELILGIQSVSSSATYLLLAFEMKHLAACWYCAPLFAKDITKETLQLPQSYIPMAFFTVGYPTNSVKPPPRKNLKDFVY